MSFLIAPRVDAHVSKQRAVRERRPIMELLIGLTILSLFTDLGVQVGVAILRPFDILTAAMFAFALLRGDFGLKRKSSLGVLLLLPYLGWHVISAFSIGSTNGARECVQIVIVSLFALTVMFQTDRLDYRGLGRFILIGLLVITAYNIYWHVTNGYMTGWKRLNEPKAAFTFLPMIVGTGLLFATPRDKRKYWILWVILGAIVLQSGERKALIIFGVLTAALLSRGRILATIPIGAASFGLLSLIAATTDNPYLSRQLGSLLDPLGYQSYTEVLGGDAVESLSNAQRSFALDLSKELIAQHPLIGVGSNGFIDIVHTQYATIPIYMQLSIHGEFLRILTENGAIGLFLYLSVWASGFARTWKVLLRFRQARLISKAQVTALLLIFFVPCTFYVGFEASGTHSFVVLILISMLPELLRSALPRSAFVRARLERRVGPSRSAMTLDSLSVPAKGR